MNFPVTKRSNARFVETLRDNATAGVEQNNPTLIPDTANRASSDAMAKSQLPTSWQPAAVAMPCTWAMTGTGRARILCITRLQRANNDW